MSGQPRDGVGEMAGPRVDVTLEASQEQDLFGRDARNYLLTM